MKIQAIDQFSKGWADYLPQLPCPMGKVGMTVVINCGQSQRMMSGLRKEKPMVFVVFFHKRPCHPHDVESRTWSLVPGPVLSTDFSSPLKNLEGRGPSEDLI